MKLFNFNETDLEANQKGQFSPQQVKKIHKNVRILSWAVLFVPLFMFIASMIIIPISWKSYMENPVLPASIAALVSAVVMAFVALRSRKEAQKEIESGEIKSVIIERDKNVLAQRGQYYVKTEEDRIPLDLSQYQGLKKKTRYVLYFSAYSKSILSLKEE